MPKCKCKSFFAERLLQLNAAKPFTFRKYLTILLTLKVYNTEPIHHNNIVTKHYAILTLCLCPFSLYIHQHSLSSTAELVLQRLTSRAAALQAATTDSSTQPTGQGEPEQKVEEGQEETSEDQSNTTTNTS